MWSVGKRIVLDQPGPREFFFFKAEDGIRDWSVTGVQTCALPIWPPQPVGATLAGERGAYRLGRPLPSIQVPATVQAVLAARIDRLPPGDKELLQTASVVGKDVPFALLQAIAEQTEDELHAAIGRLLAAEFLYEVGIFPDLEYTFKHALAHEVAYGSLLQGRRRQLHGQIVEAIERRYPDRLAEHIERLAHHAFRA